MSEREDLWLTWLSGEVLGSERTKLLHQALATDQVWRAEMLADLRCHGALRGLVADDGSAFTGMVAKRLSAADDVSRFLHAVRTRLPQRAIQRRRVPGSHRAWWVVAAAMLAIVLGFFGQRWTRRSEPLPMATLGAITADAQVMRGGLGVAAHEGLPLEPNDRIVVGALPADGAVEVRYPDQTRMSVLVGAQVQVWEEAGAKRVRLERGTVRCAVTRQPAGQTMRLLTSQGEAEIVGTRFDLLDDGLRTRLSVAEGLVSLRRLADGASLRVGAMQHAEIAADRPFRVEPTYAQPIRITAGGTYRGAWESTDPDQPAVTVATAEPVVIEGSWLRSCGIVIEAGDRARIVVRDCHVEGVLPPIRKRQQGRFLIGQSPASVLVEGNEVHGTTGIYLFGQSADGPPSLIIRQNRVRDLDGADSDGQGGRMPDGASGNSSFVCLNDMGQAPGAEIAWNEVVNEPGRSQITQVVNLVDTGGTAERPLLIHDNCFRGAYPFDPAQDAYSGGGICVGYHAGSGSHTPSQGFVRVQDNQIISTVNYAIAVFGGHDNEVSGNRAIASGLLPDGRRIRAQNVPYLIWDLAGQHRFQPPGYFGNILRDNISGWVRWAEDGSPQAIGAWMQIDADGFHSADYRSTGNRDLPLPLTRADEEREWQHWLAKMRDHDVSIGSRAEPAAADGQRPRRSDDHHD